VYNTPEQKDETDYIEQPNWVWCPFRSDQPFGKGLVESKANESGLFENLLQRRGGPVRRLVGRYLQVALVFESDGRYSPCVHALKVYYSRFSYQEAYLPEHFRQEQAVIPELDQLPANGADVRERLLAAFEATWTPLEGQISSTELLIHPQFTPAGYLPMVAQALGQNLPEHWPEARKRRWLMETGNLQHWRGTLYGVQLALDILTDGAVAKGQVVLVENFRLRRTMATILGVLMDDEDHPLTLGTGVSGNSIVGDSLILADEDQRDFIALFAPGLADATEKKIVANFFDRYANQVTVLLHGDARRFKDTVADTLTKEMPAHVVWRLVETDHPFVLGLAPLLGVDTFIERQPPARPVILDDTWIGREGLLKNPPAFSPRDVHSRTA
jgi:phage tail-like protein